MKYIKTTKGIWEIEKLAKRDYEWLQMGENKQANTIEELCDEFVWISVDNEYHNRKANEYGLRTSKMQLGCPQLKEIYGAIWTDKGLIYVAKMNDKGELELLWDLIIV